MSDLIDKQAAIEIVRKAKDKSEAHRMMVQLPSAQSEQLTDTEQRIFLKAIEREEKVCKQVDEEWGSGDEECEINLVHVCHEIIRKVKAALWTN